MGATTLNIDLIDQDEEYMPEFVFGFISDEGDADE